MNERFALTDTIQLPNPPLHIFQLPQLDCFQRPTDEPAHPARELVLQARPDFHLLS